MSVGQSFTRFELKAYSLPSRCVSRIHRPTPSLPRVTVCAQCLVAEVPESDLLRENGSSPVLLNNGDTDRNPSDTCLNGQRTTLSRIIYHQVPFNTCQYDHPLPYCFSSQHSLSVTNFIWLLGLVSVKDPVEGDRGQVPGRKGSLGK